MALEKRHRPHFLAVPLVRFARMAEPPDDLELIVINGRVAHLKKRLHADASLAARRGLVALAALTGEYGTVEMLLAHGASADDDASDDQIGDETALAFGHRSRHLEHMHALDFACLRADIGLVRLLLEHGARIGAEHLQLAGSVAADHPGDPTWARCSEQCVAVLADAKRRRARRRLRAAIASVAALRAWHARAAERAYAPDGAGYLQAEQDFARRLRVGDVGR